MSGEEEFCKNWCNLSKEDQRVIEEELYRKQLIRKWGYRIGDPRLTSSTKIGELHINKGKKEGEKGVLASMEDDV